MRAAQGVQDCRESSSGIFRSLLIPAPAAASACLRCRRSVLRQARCRLCPAGLMRERARLRSVCAGHLLLEVPATDAAPCRAGAVQGIPLTLRRLRYPRVAAHLSTSHLRAGPTFLPRRLCTGQAGPETEEAGGGARGPRPQGSWANVLPQASGRATQVLCTGHSCRKRVASGLAGRLGLHAPLECSRLFKKAPLSLQ